ncbi:hypothetical protein [Sulfurimonas sp.]|uniref:hypothetical protein n=1 Tax=Sulfurimonas sp. TaxID=2022749 RepID=UPI0026145F3B|nr:hypothetical protein [Sulfurimonas sp.]
MKKILKISAVVSLMLFGSLPLLANSSNSSKSVQQQSHFKPVLEAEDLVQVASKLDKSNHVKALSLLDKAESALQKASVSPETKELKTKISAIEKAIKNNEATDKLYSDTIFKFDAYINKIKQWGYEIRAHDEEMTDIQKFKTEEKGDVY